MIEALKAFVLLMGLPPGRLRSIAVWLANPMMTALLIGMLYAGGHIVRERDVLAGLRTAFIASDVDLMVKRQVLEAAELQAELRTAAVVSHVVEAEMTKLLELKPPPARVRVTAIHNGIANLTGVAMLRADNTNAVARPGRSTGGLSVNLPISSVASFSPELLKGHCFIKDVADLAVTPGREHLESFGAERFISCPVTYESQTMGILTVYWDRGDVKPSTEQEEGIADHVQQTADRMSAVLSLRGRPAPGTQ